jgi:hypothetical protein
VDFQADLEAHGEVSYRLRAAPPGAANQPIARVDGNTIHVNAGPLAFSVPRDRFTLLENVKIDLDGDRLVDIPLVGSGHRGGVRIVRTDGTLYTSAQDVDVTAVIEENGPLRAVIRIDGRHRLQSGVPATLEDGTDVLPDLEFTVRIQAWAGKPQVGVTYTVRNPERFLTSAHNRGGTPTAQVFESLSLVLPISTLGDPLKVRFGGDANVSTEFPGTERGKPPLAVRLPGRAVATLYQDSSGGESWNAGDRGTTFRGWIAEAEKQLLGRGRHAEGWGSAGTPGWNVTAGIRNFWENFPKGLRFGGDGRVLVDLWPAQWREPHRLEGGRQKTHHVFLDFRRGEEPASEDFRSFSSPLRATVPLAWASSTLALGPLAGSVDPEGPADWMIRRVGQAVVDSADGNTNLWAERARQDLYGWRDFGDGYRAGDPDSRHFGNNEFDFGYGMLLQYLRRDGADARYLDAAESMLQHLIDIDVYHTDRDAKAYSRGIRQHDTGSTSDHSKPPLLSHAWIRGLITYHWLTGNPQARDAAIEIGSWIENLVDPRTGELSYHGQSRSQAWAALALTELWELTGERRYLESAGRLLHTEVVADQDLPGARYPCPGLDWEGDSGELDREAVSPWQNGYVAEALGRYAFMRRLAGAADRSAENGLYRLLDELAVCGFATPGNELFVPSDPDRDNEVYGRRYEALVVDWRTADGGWTIANPNNHFLTDGYAYGALLTTDPGQRRRYLDLAEQTWRWTMGPLSSPGTPRSNPQYCCPATPAKNAGMRLRFGQTYLWLRERLQRAATAPTGR